MSSAQDDLGVGDVVWRPGDDVLRTSRLAAFIASLGLADLTELCERSNADPAWFWDHAIKDIGVEFYTPYTQVLDDSDGIQRTRWWRGAEMNIVHSCLDRYAGTPAQERNAIIWESEAGATRTLTYAQLREQVDAAAAGFRSLGITRGERVGLFMPMLPEVTITVLALAKIGAVLVPIFSGYGAEAVATRLENCDAVALVCADGFARRGTTVPMKATADAAADLAPTVKHVVVVENAGADVAMTDRDITWAALLAAGEQIPIAAERMDPEDPLMIIYTSGTTGSAKGTVHTHGGFPVKCTGDMAHGFDASAADTIFWFTDIGWMMGPWLIYGAMALGATMVMYEGSPDTPTTDRLWQMIERHKVTIFGLSPTLVRSLMNAPSEGPAGYDLSSLRMVGATGELWDEQSWQWCFDNVCRGEIPLLNYCGGTELSGGILCGNLLTPLRPRSFAGPLPGIFADVVDETGASVRGQVGELVLRGPNPGMTRGFWRDEQRYLDTYWSRFEGIWVHGDFAYVDAVDGLWYVLGRSDDTIKVAGKRIGPGEVETILTSHPSVAAAAAIGMPDDVKGSRLVCFVVARSGASTDGLAEQLSTLIADALGKPLRPSAIEIVADLPRTRNGKIVRRALRAAYAGSDVADASSIENVDALALIRQLPAARAASGTSAPDTP